MADCKTSSSIATRKFALAGSLQVLTAGIDGQLHLLPMQWERGAETSTSSQTCYSDQGQYVSYYDAQWASIDTFVTASTTGKPSSICLPYHTRFMGGLTLSGGVRAVRLLSQHQHVTICSSMPKLHCLSGIADSVCFYTALAK